MTDPQLPRVQAKVLDAAGFASREWYDFFRDLVAVASQGTEQEAQIVVLQAAVQALEDAGSNLATLLGPASVSLTGTLAGGSVTFRLVNDSANPGATRYYGTDAAGTKGFHPAVAVTYETVSKNLASWDATYAYTLGVLDTITYTDGVDTIVKTFGYTLGVLTSITLSGDTPGGIELVKTLTYTGADLTSVDYT
jgi:hypothetical protein